jgi:septal ring factor EnvC (AmiA/AmiB activator)
MVWSSPSGSPPILVMHICEPKPDEVIESIQAGVQIKPGKVSKKVRKRMQREAREEALRREIDRIEAERIVAERAAARDAAAREQAEKDSPSSARPPWPLGMGSSCVRPARTARPRLASPATP